MNALKWALDFFLNKKNYKVVVIYCLGLFMIIKTND